MYEGSARDSAKLWEFGVRLHPGHVARLATRAVEEIGQLLNLYLQSALLIDLSHCTVIRCPSWRGRAWSLCLFIMPIKSLSWLLEMKLKMPPKMAICSTGGSGGG